MPDWKNKTVDIITAVRERITLQRKVLQSGRRQARSDAALRNAVAMAGLLFVIAACSSSRDKDSLPPPVAAKADAAIASKDSAYPDPASVPDKPKTQSKEERQQIAEALIADRSRAEYTREALRGGTEPPAPPPSPAPPPLPELTEKALPEPEPVTTAEAGKIPLPEHIADKDFDKSGGKKKDEVETAALANVETAPPPPPADVPPPASVGDSKAQMPGASEDVPLLPPSETASMTPLPSSPSSSSSSSDISSNVSRSSSSSSTTTTTTATTATATEAPLATRGARERIAKLSEMGGQEPVFAASNAPPLPKEASSVLSPSQVAQYNAAIAGEGGRNPFYVAPEQGYLPPAYARSAYGATQTASSAAAPVTRNTPAYAPPTDISATAMGGPYEPVVVGGDYSAGEEASGNLPLMPKPGSAAIPSAPGEPLRLFFGDSYNLTTQQRQALSAAVTHADAGGVLRIVGHSSSRTGDMPLDDHMKINLEASQKRANAVVAALVKLGVDPKVMTVEARSDAEPLYYEAMPAGETGNRRVEIYMQ
jgi:flagellar motor protein MotB